MPQTAWIIGIAVTVMVFSFLLWRQRASRIRAVAAERDRYAAAAGELEKARSYNLAYVAEARHLADVRVPACLEIHARHMPGAVVPGLSQATFDGSALDESYLRLLEALGKTYEALRQDVGGSARMVVEHLLDEPLVRMTRLSSQILAEIERHQDPDVVESLMRLDGLASTARHAVQRGLILAGAWPGVQRDTSPIGDVVEAARGRVETPANVKHLYSSAASDVWVHGRVVEPLVVALTELLDNAAKHSARPVDVRVQDAATGYAIVVDDAGIGMNTRQREQANALMSSETGVDLTSLGDGGQVGFHIVGALCRRYGFRAEVAGPSAFGGTRVVMLIPREDIATGITDTAGHEPSAARLANPPMHREQRAVPAPRPAEPMLEIDAEGPRTASGLPVRRRGAKPSPGPGPQLVRGREAGAEAFDPDEAAAGLANFSRAFNDSDEGDQT